MEKGQKEDGGGGAVRTDGEDRLDCALVRHRVPRRPGCTQCVLRCHTDGGASYTAVWLPLQDVILWSWDNTHSTQRGCFCVVSPVRGRGERCHTSSLGLAALPPEQATVPGPLPWPRPLPGSEARHLFSPGPRASELSEVHGRASSHQLRHRGRGAHTAPDRAR